MKDISRNRDAACAGESYTPRANTVLQLWCVPELISDAQILVVARSLFVPLKLVHQLRLFLKRSDLATVTHALVTS